MNNKGKRAVYFTTGDNYTKTEKKANPGKFTKASRGCTAKINN